MVNKRRRPFSTLHTMRASPGDAGLEGITIRDGRAELWQSRLKSVGLYFWHM
jgi:hypothetical protein